MQIIPTVNKQDFKIAREWINTISETTKWIQIDVADGVLTPGKSFELELLNNVEMGHLWEVHLRVREPIKWLEKCIFVGANRIIGQVEMMTDREMFVKSVKDEGLEVGLGFDIDTQVDNVPEGIDLVLLMSRKAGFEERPFDEKVLEKIKMVKDMGLTVGVDGGVGAEQYQILKDLGVDVVYSESNYFELKNANG